MKKNKITSIPTIEKKLFLQDQKKQVMVLSPDIGNMQEVIIDYKTKIYIAADASAEEARDRYLSKMKLKYKY